ncbi:MAG: BTAD domain-containing putative transcriptional regulator [Mycobacteriales bacterium]
MQFRVLGPLEARAADGRVVPLGAPKHRTVLAVLLLRRGGWVGAHRLIEALWPGNPPPSAASAVRTYVSALRRTLGLSRLAAEAGGYRLPVAAADLDLLLFERYAADGQHALAAGDPERAADRLAAALDLWRGRPLADVPLDAEVEAEVAGWEEGRLAAREAWLEARLALGEHVAVLPELRALTAAEPLRERPHAQWMVALYRTGRQAEALDAYLGLRDRLAAELGVDPSPPVRRLYAQILAADPVLEPVPAPAPAVRAAAGPPRQLPPDLTTFTGRALDLAVLRQHLLPEGATAVPIVALDGPAGVGKSALAVRVAHELADRFPDGQLYCDLRGASPLPPWEPVAVLGRFLRALGAGDVPAAEAGTESEAAERFRAATATRRLLVVLDNAADAAQVRPLLPGGPGCAVLVTSRQVLSTLDGAVPLHVAVLTPGEAVALLGRLAGPARVAGERSSALTVAGCCGYLPLAVRIAGARLAARPSWPVAELADRLVDTQRRLDELEADDLGVRASFQVSFRALDPAAAAAFALLGRPDGPDLGLDAAAALLGVPSPDAERVLERLVDRQLVESALPGRYRLHDLLRLYARERPVPSGGDGLARLHAEYLARAWRSFELIFPGDPRAAAHPGAEFASQEEALDWMERERANLVAAVDQAAAAGDPAVATGLAQALYGFCLVRGHWADWVAVNRTALAAAGAAGDRVAEAYAHRDLGVACEQQGRYAEAAEHLERSLSLFDAGSRQVARLMNSLGIVYFRLDRPDDAVRLVRDSLALREAQRDLPGQATCLVNLGGLYHHLDRRADALACLYRARDLFGDLGDRRGQAGTLATLAEVYERHDRMAEALTCAEGSLARFTALGDRPGEAEALRQLGRLHRVTGRYAEASACLRDALEVCRTLGDDTGEARCRAEWDALPGSVQDSSFGNILRRVTVR